MKGLTKVEQNSKKKVKLILILLIPFISIIVVIGFRHKLNPTNEEIIEKVRALNSYESIVEFKIINARGEYIEKANLHTCKKDGVVMEFGEDIKKTYKDNKINIKYKNGKEYNLEKDTDEFYILATMEKLFEFPVSKISSEKEEWGDLEYVKVEIDVNSQNKHLDKAIVYLDKEKKEPKLIKIYDTNGKERVNILYREFKKNIDC